MQAADGSTHPRCMGDRINHSIPAYVEMRHLCGQSSLNQLTWSLRWNAVLTFPMMEAMMIGASKSGRIGPLTL